MKIRIWDVLFVPAYVFSCLFLLNLEANALVCQSETCNQQMAAQICGNSLCEPDCGENLQNCPSDCSAPRCGDNNCQQFTGENNANCPQDCSATAICGDGVISAGENCQNCPADVPICNTSCGDAVCSSSLGETCLTCSDDCGSCGFCGDGTCNSDPNGLETTTNCPQDCPIVTTTTTTTIPAICDNNGFCGLHENFANCPNDCHCGDGICNANQGEDSIKCPEDCQAVNTTSTTTTTTSIQTTTSTTNTTLSTTTTTVVAGIDCSSVSKLILDKKRHHGKKKQIGVWQPSGSVAGCFENVKSDAITYANNNHNNKKDKDFDDYVADYLVVLSDIFADESASVCGFHAKRQEGTCYTYFDSNCNSLSIGEVERTCAGNIGGTIRYNWSWTKNKDK